VTLLASRPSPFLEGLSEPQKSARRFSVEALERFVEPTDAPEARRERDLPHRHSRVVNELLRKKHTAGLRDCNRRRSEVLVEEPAELPFADP